MGHAVGHASPGRVHFASDRDALPAAPSRITAQITTCRHLMADTTGHEAAVFEPHPLRISLLLNINGSHNSDHWYLILSAGAAAIARRRI
jgi:hypothetical protein